MTNIVQNEWQYGLCECYRNPGICCKVGTGERDTDLVLTGAGGHWSSLNSILYSPLVVRFTAADPA